MRNLNPSPLKTAAIAIIKIGSSTLIKDERLRKTWLHALAEDVAMMHQNTQKVIIVTSGAIALGKQAFLKDNFSCAKAELTLPQKQAAASHGQPLLMSAYAEAFGACDMRTSQILLTRQNLVNKKQRQNALETLEENLKAHIVPIINENDAVATEEICFGDNDKLAALVGVLFQRDANVLLLSDVDGLYTADPHKDLNAKHIPLIHAINKHIRKMAGDTQSNVGTGGMASKLEAAKIALRSGFALGIGSGEQDHALRAILNGESRSTWFRRNQSPKI